MELINFLWIVRSFWRKQSKIQRNILSYRKNTSLHDIKRNIELMHDHCNKPLRILAGSAFPDLSSELILEVKQKKRQTDPCGRKLEAEANKIK